MTLYELSFTYEESADLLRARIHELQQQEKLLAKFGSLMMTKNKFLKIVQVCQNLLCQEVLLKLQLVKLKN